ncbi:MAG TPA: response regulator transcription factor [Flavisolibacter sp.]|nr:response regulator transcription factor [Flavisolibacter sp.]
MRITIALADDHVLLRNGLANLLQDLDFEVVFQADNGKQFIEKLKTHTPPQVVLMDINMPVMDGYDTTLWLKKNHPDVKVLALSMYNDENAIIRMLKSGAKGYLLKDSSPMELKAAIQSLATKGFYYSELVTGTLIHTINHMDDPESAVIKDVLGINERELEMLKLICTELTFKEIAEKMQISPRTVDGYRDILLEKLQCKSRIGLVIFAIKNGIIVI